MAAREIITCSSHPQSASVLVASDYTRPLAVVTTLFFMWGFLTCLNDILVPHLKSIFDLSYARVMLVQFAFFSAYFLFSVPWSRIVNMIGYQRTMVVGLLTMALGSFLFLPAASAASYRLFLTALLILAAGITGLQVAANPYVVVLGKPETGSSRLNLTQAFNSLGTTIAPKVGGLLILSAAPLAIGEFQRLSPQALHSYRIQQAASVRMPYTVIGVTLVLLAILIGTFKLPKIETAACRPGQKVNDSIWKHPSLVLAAVGIFAYVGAEVSIGSFLVNYFESPEIAGFSAKTAAGFVSFYWGGAMVGRFLGAGLLRQFKPRNLLAMCAVFATTLVISSMVLSGHAAMWAILAVGLFNSIMFPTIFSLGVAELGPLTGNGSGILNMAIVGGAILPVIQGVIADRVGIHHAFVLPVICYLYILHFGLSGSKPNSERYAKA
ncbi:MAG: sugar MFS transporter [Terriglobales bacterium]